MWLLARGAYRFLATAVVFFPLMIAPLTLPPVSAQTQQPFLFAGEASNGQVTDFAVFVRNDQTGNLTEVSGSPFTSLHSRTCVMTIVDPKGRFAYGPCGLGASMYTLNATTGAVAEVTGSPFGASTDTTLGDVAAESTGQYVYVLKFSLNDSNPSTVLLDTFQVDATDEQLVAQSSQSVPLDGTLVAVAASQYGFYLLLNQSQGSNAQPSAVLYAILFDPTSGQASGPQSLAQTSNNARFLMMDGFGKNLVVSAGQDSGSLWFFQLSPIDGTVSAVNSVALAFQEFATPVAFDPTSSFFYVQFEGTGATETGIRIFDVSTQTETASSPVPASLESELGGQPDPQGPFSYFSGPSPGGGISVFGVDPTTGYPISPTAFSNPLFPGRDLGPGPATVDVNTEPVQVPAASLSTTSLNFGSVNVGQTSVTQDVTLTSTGGVVLSLTSIQVTGANAGDFTETDTCMSSPQLQPNKSCTITVSYHPSAAGSGSATILITDNASGSPQQIALTGTGTNPPPPPPPAPGVTLNPNPLNFPGTITEGTLSSPQNVVLTNSGNATLHVQTIVLGGTNSSDFTISANNCIGQVAANTNCVVSLTFAPLGPGVRSATLTITDDASNSPQTLNIQGTGGTAAQITAAGGSTTASVTAGQPAQFNLQATAGSGFTGTLTFVCSGALVGAICAAPSSVAVAGSAPTAFTVTVTTSGASMLIPSIPRGSLPELGIFLSILAALFCLLLSLRIGPTRDKLNGWALRAAADLLLVITVGAAGCGGGAAGSSAPQQAVAATPAGIYTITLTPTATSSATSKQFPLNAISLTLTVN